MSSSRDSRSRKDISASDASHLCITLHTRQATDNMFTEASVLTAAIAGVAHAQSDYCYLPNGITDSFCDDFTQ